MVNVIICLILSQCREGPECPFDTLNNHTGRWDDRWSIYHLIINISEIEVECDLICQEIKKDHEKMVDDGNCFKTCLSVSQSTISSSFEFTVGKCQQEVMIDEMRL